MHQPLRWPLLPRRLAVRLWARRMVRRGALVLDTETTDFNGSVVELAVVDCSGRVLLDTLINPGCPITPAATAVHGIRDADLVDAPTLSEVLPQLRALVGRRPLLAYNAPFDHQAICEDAGRLGVPLGTLARRRSWGCLMRARSAATGAPWIRLDGGHRAAGDAVAASEVLRDLAGYPNA